MKYLYFILLASINGHLTLCVHDLMDTSCKLNITTKFHKNGKASFKINLLQYFLSKWDEINVACAIILAYDC